MARFYTKNITVEDSFLDEMKHVNNVVFLKLLQDVAIDHWYAEADQAQRDSIRWIARKHEIEYLKPAFLNDLLKIDTWIESFNAVSTLRKYEIYKRDQLIVQASTLWVALDANSLKPMRLSQDILAKFQ